MRLSPSPPPRCCFRRRCCCGGRRLRWRRRFGSCGAKAERAFDGARAPNGLGPAIQPRHLHIGEILFGSRQPGRPDSWIEAQIPSAGFLRPRRLRPRRGPGGTALQSTRSLPPACLGMTNEQQPPPGRLAAFLLPLRCKPPPAPARLQPQWGDPSPSRRGSVPDRDLLDKARISEGDGSGSCPGREISTGTSSGDHCDCEYAAFRRRRRPGRRFGPKEPPTLLPARLQGHRPAGATWTI